MNFHGSSRLFGYAGLLLFAAGVAVILLSILLGARTSDPGVKAGSKVKASSERAFQWESGVKGLTDTSGQALILKRTDLVSKGALDDILDQDIFDSALKPTQNDVFRLQKWALLIKTIGRVFLLSGLDGNIRKYDLDDPSLQNVFEQNTLKFPDEIGRFLDSQILIDGMIAIGDQGHPGPSVEDHRQAFLGDVFSSLTSIGRRSMDDRWRLARAFTLIRVAPILNRVLKQQQCRFLRNAASEVSLSLFDKSVRASLNQFVDLARC